ncbi:FAD-dependent oxidoreductase [Streptomyces antimycoticus]|uniref:FAD-dependent oxidoreductase n=1 Tax=Streptomyces antimycoticus TaxID=68175 RepID=UPI00368F9C10
MSGPHGMSGPDGRPAGPFGSAHAGAVGPDFEEAVTAQLAQCFGRAAATPDILRARNRSTERWTVPSPVRRLADYSLFGHPRYQQPALDGRLHWASTGTATAHAGHIEGAPASAERAAHDVLATTPGTTGRRGVSATS